MEVDAGGELLADAERLELALDALIENAVGATDQGDRILLRVGCEGDEAIIEVLDDGMGIAPGHLPRVFDRFWRVNGARARDNGGTGLGLSIVKAIVEAHGGTVTVTSALGEGTTFTIRLPGYFRAREAQRSELSASS